PDPADRRARLLYLTPKARPFLDEIWRLSALTRAETFAAISRQEREAFMGILQRMQANLCAFDPHAAGDSPLAPPIAANAAAATGRHRRTPTR
ncbi:MAG: hypothetical protein ABI190_03400, partial [Casimicrobiaceae bacterium]